MEGIKTKQYFCLVCAKKSDDNSDFTGVDGDNIDICQECYDSMSVAEKYFFVKFVGGGLSQWESGSVGESLSVIASSLEDISKFLKNLKNLDEHGILTYPQ